ncbi:MAG: family 16 glycoside hydrolase, partial [Planctomycetota bacterium]
MKLASYLKFVVVTLVVISAKMPFAAADEFIDVTQEGVSQADFELQGEYRGADGEGVQVVALGNGKFLVQTYNGGLPGGGWDGKDRESVEDDTEGVNEYIEEIELRKVQRRSSTVGAKPPTGAVVLFDGSAQSLSDHWKGGAKRTDDGLLKQGATSKDTFRDYTLHLEFRLPFEPTKRGQGRSNSGVYHQGRYETQVLDSFGLDGKHNECGGIYSVQKPSVNMCLPPGTWQTYDVEFTAARWADGKKVRDARMTVKLNGVVVHRNVEVPKTTTAAPLGESNEPGPIYIQDHGNEIRFRNIWVLPRDGDREEARPRIAGFERFHANQSSGDVLAGELLIGELGCKSCHRVSNDLDNRTWHKMAPILDNVGSRLKSGWIARFVSDPHGTKPGTTMPNLFTGWSDEQKQNAAVALASYLVHDQRDEPTSAGGSSELGFQIFESVGCLACHDSRSSQAKKLATSVPLLDLDEKYHARGLRDFLRDPVSVRPSGRMPSCGLNRNEAASVARYLTQSTEPTMRFAAYEGRWEKLPDFDSMEPYLEGGCYGFSVKVAARGDSFGLRFVSRLEIPADGNYRFTTKSDDGSRLYIDDKLVVDNDDVHGVREKDGKIDLTKGMHEVRVEFFERDGGEELTCTIEGPDLPREDLAGWLTLEDKPAASDKDDSMPSDVYRADLVAEGERLFATMGCASCHQKTKGGQPVVSRLSVPPVNNLNGGCMSTAAPSGAGPTRTIPDFYLSKPQQASLAVALSNQGPRDRTPQDLLRHQMTALNCYACHERDGIGGPEEDRNKSFKTTQREMGDEARVPPPLNGVGDKLRKDWIDRVLTRGEKARPYMLTRMPKFGDKNIAGLTDAFVSMDRKEMGAAKLATVDMPGHKLKATGRKLVGDKAFACVKCHVFGKTPATGVQAVDLQTMTKRVREDWFHRYLQDPNAYRPGTRMPSGFVDGKSVAPKILEGNPPNQLAAMWAYLGQGSKAGKPSGIGGKQIELVPREFPIIYRNFIEGLSARGIAVGYPESLNLAWDAEA